MSTAFTKVEEIGFLALQEQLRVYKGKPSEAFPPSYDVTSRQNAFTIRRTPATFTHGLTWFQDGVHFDLSTHPLAYLGQKILTSAITDAYALFSSPDHIRVALAIPNLVSVEMIHTFMEGLDKACKEAGVSIAGLECNPAHQHFGIAVSMLSVLAEAVETGENRASGENGETGANGAKASKGGASATAPSGAKASKGASEGEVLCVTGDLGAAFAGLRVLLREKRAWQRQSEADSTTPHHFQPDLQGFERVVERQLAPKPRTDFIQAVEKSAIRPSAMVPLRLGLYNDIHQLMSVSKCGAEVYVSALPIDPQTRTVADEMQEEVDRYALAGGEDFEFLFTLSHKDVEPLQQEFKDFVVIGKVLNREKGLVVHTPGEE